MPLKFRSIAANLADPQTQAHAPFRGAAQRHPFGGFCN